MSKILYIIIDEFFFLQHYHCHKNYFYDLSHHILFYDFLLYNNRFYFISLLDYLDTPSPNKIRPLVNPHTFQITSRGRVAFTVLPTTMPLILSNVGDIGSDNVASISSMMNYLSPEYISAASNKKAIFSESDIEKVNIFLHL